MAMAMAMLMPMAGSFRAPMKVASPSGKLWIPTARAEKSPMRISSFFAWGRFPFISSTSFISWGFSAEGTKRSMS